MFFLVFSVFQLFYSKSTLKAETNTYRVCGNINCQESGTVYIYLVDRNGFDTPFTGVKTLSRIIDRKGSCSFCFYDVKTGDYGIRCFQDKNGNGSLDRALFRPKEPWGLSWQTDRRSMPPSFEDIAFSVATDVDNITIELER